jgi:hypothetical protein
MIIPSFIKRVSLSVGYPFIQKVLLWEANRKALYLITGTTGTGL